jgi:predicted metal-dependent hydrolase
MFRRLKQITEKIVQKQLSIPDVGIVIISKKTNATRIKMRVHPEKGVLVTIPYSASFSEAETFIAKNIDWLKEKTTSQKISGEVTLFKPDSVFQSRKTIVRFIQHEKNSISAKLKHGNLDFYYNPTSIDFNNSEIQEFIKKAILKALKIEAEPFLVDKTKKLAAAHNIKINSISIGTAGTRWGSCNSRDELNLSCRLMFLPDNLIDYIILHELCHVAHKNHSKRFHDLLDKLVDGKSKSLNTQLKKHSTQLKPGDFTFQN